jgi:FMN-dependent oxidoreductase (nitrilotriacetate monooxygenase family)
MTRPRQLKLAAFMRPASIHTGAWRYPGAFPDANFNVARLKRFAQTLERGKFDAFFMADHMAVLNMPIDALKRSHTVTSFEPFTLLSALSQVTEHIGLVATGSTTFDAPYHVARRFASLDHLSGGRAGWNIVTTAGDDAAKNFGLDGKPGHRDRYKRAAEFVDVSIRLWDSWEDDAALGDKAAGRYADAERIHPVEYEGEHFRVRGALNVSRCPQGRPLLVQAGSSADGRAFAARYAEAIFTAHQTLGDGQEFYADMKNRARGFGRDPELLKILPGIVPAIGSTEAEARALEDELESLIIPEYGLAQLSTVLEVPPEILSLDRELPAEVFGRPEVEGMQSRRKLITDLASREHLTVRQLIGRLGGGRGHRTFTGTPEQVADAIQEWFDLGAADGFNIMPPALPSGLETFVDHVIPIFRARGLFRTEYTGTTLRDHYGLPRPESQYAEMRARGVPEPAAL